MLAILAKHRVTRLTVVPSLLGMILDCGLDPADAAPDIRLWQSSGETLPVDLARPGQSVGVEITQRVREHDEVFRVSDG